MAIGRKYGGRQKGTPNKSNKMVKEIVEEALGMSLPEAILKELDKVQAPDFRSKVMIDLLPYCYTKTHAPIKVEAEVNSQTKVSHDLDNYKKQLRAQMEADLLLTQKLSSKQQKA